MRAAFFGIIAFLSMTGCSGGSPSSAGDSDSGVDDSGVDSGDDGGVKGSLPCAVDTVLAQSCRNCHGKVPTQGAPMALVTLADLHQPSFSDPQKPVYVVLGVRIHSDQLPMPPTPNPRLGAADLATLDAWVMGGGKAAGPGECAAAQ